MRRDQERAIRLLINVLTSFRVILAFDARLLPRLVLCLPRDLESLCLIRSPDFSWCLCLC